MAIFLRALALQSYRGIGTEMQKMTAFQDFNFFIGANNAGKSSVLDFLSRHLVPSARSDQSSGGLTALEQHAGGTLGPPLMAFGVPLEEFYRNAAKRITTKRPDIEGSLREVCDKLADGDVVWLKNSVPLQKKYEYLQIEDQSKAKNWLHPSSWQTLWSAFSQGGGGSLREHWIPQTLSQMLAGQSVALPPVRIIPAIREIGPKNQSFGDYSGRGLIDKLAELQSPDHDRRADRLVFEKINSFLQTVTNHSSAHIEIPHHREHILVHMNEKVLPLASLGTGIQEVIMIAAFCTISDGEIVCIEEPEIHLHPLLQRKLVEYLKENTNNQYFIATHSPAFIDTPDAAIFHVYLDQNMTRVRRSVLRADKFEICQDLGHRASDLIQSNAVIWVEGPSDRVYLNHWLSSVTTEFVEGIHYSIMFYGGRLLSHLSADDEEVEDFISLKSLNRNLAILIDSDRRRAGASINATKQRVVRELQGHPGLAWVTKGREIENYIPLEKVQSAVKEIYTNYDRPFSSGSIYEAALPFWQVRPKRRKSQLQPEDLLRTDIDKIKVAKEVCSGEADLGILDLKDRLAELVALIKRANS